LCPAALGVAERYFYWAIFWSIIMKQVTFLLVMAVASTGWCADPAPAKKAPSVNGKWALTSGVMSGEKMDEDMQKSIQLTLMNGKYTTKIGDQTDEGTYTTDETKTPHTLTITSTDGPNKGKTFLAIYELDKGTMKVCYDMSGKAFPTAFESKASTPSFLATYKRQASAKKKPFKLGAGGAKQ
jgi:uncharacterized protein (TIGR03067 family)